MQHLPIQMDNKWKEFEKLLLNNTLFQFENQTLGDQNPKWKEWCQNVQEFMDEQTEESLEIVNAFLY